MSSANASPEAMIERLSCDELSAWQGRAVDPVAYQQEMLRLNDTTYGVFVYSVDDAEVSLLAKPDHLFFDMLHARAQTYLSFFRTVLADRPTKRRFLFALETGDQPLNCDFPTLSFQKLVGDRTILINDVNLIEASFYEGAPFIDLRAFADKRDKAIFVGSTSGLFNTRETLRSGANARIEAAKFFKDHDGVDFWLPNVVQADAEAEADIRALQLGDRIVGWDEQLGYKLLLSLDGNGAACQRLAVALKSNSAVVKYDSRSMLYYFPALQPKVHYLPVSSDAEVLDLFDAGVVRDEYAEVAENGAAFFQSVLNREAGMAYASRILSGFGRLLDG